MEVQKYLDVKREIESKLVQFLNEDSQDEADSTILIQYLKDQKYDKYWNNFEEKLYLILAILNNLNPTSNIIEKTERIFLIIQDDIKKNLTNAEIFTIFRSNKIILLYLFKNKILIPDQSIIKNKQMKNFSILAYFYPEFKDFFDDNQLKKIKGIIYYSTKFQIDESNIQIFEEQRKSFENSNEICRLIRNDLIEEFIIYVNEKNINLSSKINPSIFETNSFLIKNERKTTLIEYAAFYGSIQIFQYLKNNNVKLSPSLWLYVIHSRNAELINILEENNVQIHSRDLFLKELLKLHDNELTDYFINNEIVKIQNLAYGIKYCNYSYYPEDLGSLMAQYYYMKYKYVNFVQLLMNNGYKFDNGKYSKLNKLSKIYLLPNLTEIAGHYFENYEQFTQIFIPSSVTKIGYNAFKGCSSLTQINIPSSVTEIGSFAFSDCSLLTQITIPSSVTIIEGNTFSGCSSLTQITIPSSVTKIGYSSFEGCSSLTQITIPSSVTEIGDFAFSDCSLLTQIIIPSSVTKIGNNAFSKCSSLTQIIIPPSVTEIGNNTFYSCSSLRQIIIPSSVTKIEYCAFYGCSSLTQITIPSSITKIGDCVFDGCSKLVKIIIIPSENERIKYFEDKFLIYKSKFDGDFDTLIWSKINLNVVTIPPFIKMINNCAFSGCSLTQIIIPSSVTSIGDCSFYECTSLTQITFEIPSSVTSIGENAFFRCSSLKQITIPSSVIKIGPSAFDNCESLAQITFDIPSSVSSIGKDTFNKCSSLIEITIPSSVNSIGGYAFNECLSLKKITIPSSVTFIGEGAFNECSSLTQITIPSSVTKLGHYAFNKCSSLTQITIPSFVKPHYSELPQNAQITLI